MIATSWPGNACRRTFPGPVVMRSRSDRRGEAPHEGGMVPGAKRLVLRSPRTIGTGMKWEAPPAGPERRTKPPVEGACPGRTRRATTLTRIAASRQAHHRYADPDIVSRYQLDISLLRAQPKGSSRPPSTPSATTQPKSTTCWQSSRRRSCSDPPVPQRECSRLGEGRDRRRIAWILRRLLSFPF
jgi:hypothetical protein